MKIVDIKDTVDLMISPDYKERFRAEYYQLKLRYNKLKAMLKDWEDGALTFLPTCPKSTYRLQLEAMKKYLAILETRARMEKIGGI